jgi:hypothetical protein
MDRPRILRLLRIAFSVVCGIVCVLLIVLWVRSYFWTDYINLPHSHHWVLSMHGWLHIDSSLVDLSGNPGSEFKYGSFRVSSKRNSESQLMRGPGIAVPIPFGTLPLLISIVTVAPWIRWRFSLRTLLIAITLLAVLLGAIVYALR